MELKESPSRPKRQVNSPNSSAKKNTRSLSRQFGDIQDARSPTHSPTQLKKPLNNNAGNFFNGNDSDETLSFGSPCEKFSPKHISILEIGCGNSLHSLRLESEMLHALNGEKVHVIRINPNDPNESLSSKVNNSIAIELGAKESLMALHHSLNATTAATVDDSLMQVDESS